MMRGAAAGTTQAVGDRRWRDEAPLWLAACGAIGAHSFVLPGVSIADFALGIAASLAARELWRSRRFPALPSWLVWVAVAALWSLLGATALAASSPFPFSWVEFAKSFTKLLFYPAAVFLVGTTLGRITARRAADILLWALTLNAVLALYVYAVMAAGLDLPYRFLWALSQHGEETARPFVGASLLPPVRARGVASEPSVLGYFQVMGLAAVSLLTWPHWRGLVWRVAVVVASIVLTFSLTTYGLLFVLAVVLIVKGGKEAGVLVRRALLVTVAGASLLLFFPAARRAFDTAVLARVAEVVAGGRDVSATLRLSSSWEMAAAMVRSSPVFGAGLGHFDLVLEALRPWLSLSGHLYRGTQGWNALAYLLGTLGPLGLGCGLLLVWEVWRRSRPAGAMILAATFADSTILGVPFWLFYLLLYRSGAPLAEGAPRGAPWGWWARRRAASLHSPAKARSAAPTATQASDGRR